MNLQDSSSLFSSDFLIENAKVLDFGDVHFKYDAKSGLLALIAIHNTHLGPSLGGCRYKEYASLNEALFDVMRLARGMSYKSAMAGLPLGGGKSVILKNVNQQNREQMFEVFGEFIESLGGRYITAVDSGTKPEDMDVIARKSQYVSSQQGADPSPFTAKGIRQAMLAAVQYSLKRSSLEGLTIAIQGIGNVGYYLAEGLANDGARLIVSDISSHALEKIQNKMAVELANPHEIHQVECDIFAPCALGAILNDTTIPELHCKMIVGAANNQLAEDRHGIMLQERGILYGPDYVVNAGGVIYAGAQYLKIPLKEVEQKVKDIYQTTLEIFEQSDEKRLCPHVVADYIAEERMGLKKSI